MIDQRSKRVRRRAVKAHLLDVLSMTVGAWEWHEGREGLTVKECEEVAQELKGELYQRAVRLTPVQEGGSGG